MRVLMIGWEFPPHISGGLGTACRGLVQGLVHEGVDVTFVVPRLFGDEEPGGARLLEASEALRPAARPAPPPRRAGPAPALPAGRTPGSVSVAVPAAAPPPPAPAAEAPAPAAAAIPPPEAPGPPPGAAPPAAVAAPAPAPAPAGEASIVSNDDTLTPADPLPDPGPGPGPGAVEVLGVDSPLRPYMDDGAYRAERRRIEEAVRGGAAAPPGPRREREGARGAAGPGGPAAAAAGPLPAPAAAPAPPGRVDLGLGAPPPAARYGRDLFSEVSRYAAAVEAIARRGGFDVVHAHDWMTFPAGVLAARASGRPLVVHVHSCEYDRSGEGADGRIVSIEQAGLDAAARIVCVSHYTAGVLASRYRVDPSRVRVVHNAVTRSEMAPAEAREKAIPEPLVLFLGRVTFQKGPDYFLEAARLVVRQEPGVRFVLGGRGDMLPRMIEAAARLGLARHVHFTGFLSGVDVERMYAMADIYVMPSVSEPFGIAPLEAMALDVPVIVSRQSGVSEVLRNALKVDFWDVRDIANKILALLRYPVLRRALVEEGRAEVAAMRWEMRGRLLHAVYREVRP